MLCRTPFPLLASPYLPPATPDTEVIPGQCKAGAVLESLLCSPPRPFTTTGLPHPSPLTTLFIAVVPAVIVTVTVPQAPDAVAVLAGELVLLTLPGGCGQSSQAAAGRGRGWVGGIAREPKR